MMVVMIMLEYGIVVSDVRMKVVIFMIGGMIDLFDDVVVLILLVNILENLCFSIIGIVRMLVDSMFIMGLLEMVLNIVDEMMVVWVGLLCKCWVY